ncbi:unnamed protein product [Ranitomeya imitator]|uniref:ribonuclease H n=1 Tax=Ranitomeya imitator TaxID=111125 RepID=A0ABN9L6L7_9NEOB|nr:unnamed protein product [Ranitomeya imitator]
MQEIKTQLSDLDTYQPISHNPTFEIGREIKDLVTYYTTMGTIDTKLGEFLIKQHPVIPVFYTLPKIHKHPSKPPGRPIVASTESLLSPLAITLDKILSPLVPRIKSYLRDTSDFFTSLMSIGGLPPNCLLVTMDVNSLYTSIRHSEGIESVMSFLSRHTDFSDQQRKFCKDSLTMVLTRIFFMFEDQFFIQKRGTAMGSNMAPPYANIFMDQFEMSFVYTHSSFKSYVAYWHRYIDDVFLIWTGDVSTLLSFHTHLNSSLPGLTFSLSYDYTSMNFLDTKVIINASRNIETDLLLKYDSCHPHHIKRALPKSQHERVDRIVSNPDTSRLRHSEMSAKFRSRGYPDHVLTFKQNTLVSDVSLRVPRLAFVSTFHPFNSLINKCILQHWDILKNAYPQVKEFNVKPIICNKRCSNIKDCLVKADVGPSIRGPIQRVLSSPRNGTFPCLGCHQCSNITKGDSFTHPRSGKHFFIRGHFTCNSSFVVYLIKCPCGLGYVGETTQHVRDRISKHKSTIRCGRSLLPIPAHFLQHNHTVAQLRYQVIDHVPLARRGGDRIKQLKERESFWIYTLQTLSPHGLNREVVQNTGVDMDIQGLSSLMDNLAISVQNIQDLVVQNPMLEPKIPIPELFSGDRTKFLNFKNNCKLFLALKPRSSGDPVQQVKIIISLLRGDPQDWAFSLAPGDPALCDTDAFFLALGLLYDKPNSVDQAEKILLALCQGQDEVEIYCQKFRKWSVLTQWNEYALAAIFRKGLSEALKDVMVGFPMPAGLNESMSLAIQIDRRLRAALNLMDLEFARRCGFFLEPLQHPIPLRGIDATPLAKNKPQYWTQLTMCMAPAHREDIRFLVLQNLHDVVVLGLPWLQVHNPVLDWKSMSVSSWGCQGVHGDVPFLSISSSTPSEVPEFLSDYWDVFDEPKSNALPPHRDCDCAIDLIPGIKLQYPLPLLSDLFARIKVASWFTKIDLRGAYNLVRIEQGDEWKTAFNTPEGHFEYLVMPFGLSNAPSVFQSFMHDIFREYLDKFLIVYLDDILVFSDDWESHVKQVRMVFQVLRANSLFVKGSKCLFGVQKISFLGFIFSPSTIEMDPVKVQAIYDWTQPTSLKSLQKFLGFANFYRRFINNFSSIAKPLTDLTKKGADVVNWSSAAVEAFQELKRRFSSAPVLCQPDVSLPFQVEVDASEIGAGAVLSQRSSDGSVMKPCAFFSMKFSPAERNYDVGNRELLAMKWAFEEWRHWLEGAKHRVMVLTDHKNMTYLESAKRLNPRQARQVESSDCPGVDTVVDRLQQIWTHVVDNLTLSQEKAQRFANRRRCVGPRLRDGNQGKHRVTKRGPALSYPMFTLVTSEDIAGSVLKYGLIMDRRLIDASPLELSDF